MLSFSTWICRSDSALFAIESVSADCPLYLSAFSTSIKSSSGAMSRMFPVQCSSRSFIALSESGSFVNHLTAIDASITFFSRAILVLSLLMFFLCRKLWFF